MSSPIQICTGCNSTQSIEEIKRMHPSALSCCPERNMVDAAGFLAGLNEAYWIWRNDYSEAGLNIDRRIEQVAAKMKAPTP